MSSRRHRASKSGRVHILYTEGQAIGRCCSAKPINDGPLLLHQMKAIIHGLARGRMALICPGPIIWRSFLQLNLRLNDRQPRRSAGCPRCIRYVPCHKQCIPLSICSTKAMDALNGHRESEVFKSGIGAFNPSPAYRQASICSPINHLDAMK